MMFWLYLWGAVALVGFVAVQVGKQFERAFSRMDGDPYAAPVPFCSDCGNTGHVTVWPTDHTSSDGAGKPVEVPCECAAGEDWAEHQPPADYCEHYAD